MARTDDARFRRCLGVVLGHEGGRSNHPADRGGLTVRGITAATWGRAQRLKLAPLGKSVEDAEPADVSRIYERMYWQASGAPSLPAPLDLLLFDAAVNHGARRGVEFIQAAVGVPMDGIIGPITRRAAERAHPVSAVAGYFRARRAFYARIIAADPTQQVFARGWENRLRSLEQAAAVDLPEEAMAR